MYEEKLKKLGLTDGEARAYSALLELGSSTVGPIVSKSGISYSKIYEVLDRLVEKGIASFVIKQKTKHFQALEPTRLQEYLEKKEDEILESRKLLNEILPSLNNLNSGTKHSQEAEVFVGEKGIITAYELLLRRSSKEIFFLYTHDPIYDEKVNEMYHGIGKLLLKLGKRFSKMRMRGVINRDNYKVIMNKNLPDYMNQRIVRVQLPANMDIGDDSILFQNFSGQKPFAILIRSEELAANFRNYFESIWKLGKKDANVKI